jgi:hypothetical protein
MHPECEEKWLALKPFPPCKFCEAVLSLDDVAAKRTLHPHCEMELSPDFRLPEEVAPWDEPDETNSGCSLCGQPLYPDDISLGATTHERCKHVSQIPDDEILNEEDANPIVFCLDCGERISAGDTVGFPDFSGVWPLHRRCADARKGFTDMESSGS